MAGSFSEGSEFVLLGQVHWSSKEIIQKTKFGGISGIAFQKDKIFLVSDDRGKVNEPRFYEFDFKKDKKIWKLENGQVHLTGLPPGSSLRKVLDQEAIVSLPNGNLLISSEGDGNKKPRVPPRIFEVKTNGQWIRDIPLPQAVMPEPTGQQKTGVGNNFAFEAMTLSADGSDLYFVSERPLVQDSDLKNVNTHFRFYQMKRHGDNYQIFSEKYLQGPTPPGPSDMKHGIPVVQGFSEMIWIADHQFLALDRTLKVLGGHSLSFECRLAEIDLSGASDTSKFEKLLDGKNGVSAKITKIQTLKNGNEDLGNCEGMALGPANEEYKQTLWIITDNNFSPSEDTILYFFGVKN